MGAKLLEIDAAQFVRSFAREPFAVSNHLAGHPLLELEALAALAESLPLDRIEHNVGDLATVRDGDAPRTDLSPGEIARTIDTNGCWMVLKNIEFNSDYEQLVDETMAEIPALLSEREDAMRDREGFVFLSAPASVTPTHIDPEHNFLLQVRGRKELHIGRFPDPRVEQLELERYYCGGHRNVQWLPEDERVFVLDPGDGLYVPIHAPHFVENGPQSSVSLSVTFRTPAARRAAAVHTFNGQLRRVRIAPRPPGERQAVDRLKAGGLHDPQASLIRAESVPAALSSSGVAASRRARR